VGTAMRILLTLLLSLFSQSTEPYKQQLDLVLMLRDTQKLQKLSIMYDSPTPHGFRLLFVRGDGSLILQSYPGRPMATNDVPTCEGKVDQDKVKELVSLIIGKHFWDLPEKRFLFINGPPSHAEFELHRIFISNGIERAVRDFGVGTYAGKQESIPDDFAAIELYLQKLAESTFSNKPCHLAPAVEF
jgi:hypothetical protein